MRIMLLGVGAIGTVIARHLAPHRAVESLTLCDMDPSRAEGLAAALGRRDLRVERLDAADGEALAAALEGYDLVVNAILPRYNGVVMDGALAAGCHYLDLAGGDEDQFLRDPDWKRADRLALHGMGEDPGISNLMARYGADRLDEVETIRVRDGEFSESDEFPLACLFSTETFIEEAVSPARYFQAGAWKEVPAWSNREIYPFPAPVGPQPVYSMSHEEVDTLPRFIGKGVREVDFKLAVPDEARQHLAFLDRIGMTRRDDVKVRGGEVAPLAVLAAVLPQPADLGGRIRGAAIILVEIEGKRGGRRIRHRLHASMTHEEAFRRHEVTATALLTGTGGAAGALAIATGQLKGSGVLAPEQLEPEPILARVEELGLEVIREEESL